ncbi:hypothetical protein IOC61_02980 [Halomonas sp. KAO]|uniref:hypothetical protein n=1 Tax=Halomonas sp. KAO TaxID=2783858 RepID=UPI00189C6CAF|nr:hypothetical protein [Halomonas sp. KAO]MBF7052279.1 hypothetical protein [Halomonas sp. KAO]
MDETIKRKKADIWECVKRVDAYLNASNFKTALIFTFTFALTASLYGRWESVLGGGGEIDIGLGFYFLLTAFFISVLGTGLWGLLAVYPRTGRRVSGSIYYFPGMQRGEGARTLDEFLEMPEEDELRLIYEQYVDLSSLASRKFNCHKKSIGCAIFQLLFGVMFYVYSFFF